MAASPSEIELDERVAKLGETFPIIFERLPDLGDLDDEFVTIEVPYGSERDDGREVANVEASLLAEVTDRHLNSGDSLDITQNSNQIEFADRGVAPGLREDLIYRPRPVVLDRLRDRISGLFPGGPSGVRGAREHGFVPPPDALAFYLPFHSYPKHWGIYLIDVGVASLAMDLGLILRSQGHTFAPYETSRIAHAYLFHHEAYHCAVESLALRCELPMRKPAYRTGLRKIYMRPWIPGAPHEETLATAYGLRKVRDEMKLPKPKLVAAVRALEQYMLWCPPEYAAGVNYVKDVAFDEFEQKFIEEAINACHGKAAVLDPTSWSLGTYMLTPLIQRNRKYSWICDRNAFKLSKLAVFYSRRSDIIRCLERVAGVRSESGGRHLHLVREFAKDGSIRSRRTQVPSGEVQDGTLSGMLKNLDLGMNVHTFRQRCREAGRALS